MMKARTVGIAGTSFQLSLTLLLSNSVSCGSSDHSFLRVTPPFYIGTDSANPQNTNKMPMPGEHTRHQTIVSSSERSACDQAPKRSAIPVPPSCINTHWRKRRLLHCACEPCEPARFEPASQASALRMQRRASLTWPAPPATLHLANAPGGTSLGQRSRRRQRLVEAGEPVQPRPRWRVVHHGQTLQQHRDV